MASIWNMDGNEKIYIEVDEYGAPCTKEGAILGSFLGTIVTNGKLAPLSISRWDNKHFEPFKAKMLKIVEVLYFQFLVFQSLTL